MGSSHAESSEKVGLAQIIEEIGHYLPTQGPIKTFGHHNTLHHFEDLEFFNALDAAPILDGVNTMVATLGLIGVSALLMSRFGVRGVISPTGLGSFFPEIAVCYLTCVLSLVSFPGTLGFIEEEVLLGQAVGHHNLVVAAIAVALTLNGFSSFRVFALVFMGQPALGQDTETGLLGREREITYSIVAVILIKGLAPSYIVDSLSHMGRTGVTHGTSGH